MRCCHAPAHTVRRRFRVGFRTLDVEGGACGLGTLPWRSWRLLCIPLDLIVGHVHCAISVPSLCIGVCVCRGVSPLTFSLTGML